MSSRNEWPERAQMPNRWRALVHAVHTYGGPGVQPLAQGLTGGVLSITLLGRFFSKSWVHTGERGPLGSRIDFPPRLQKTRKHGWGSS